MNLLKRLPFCGGVEKGDARIDAIAAAITRNLRGLGLHVRAKKYGDGFCEIVASSSPKMITLPHSVEASGLALLLAEKYDPPTLVFEEINSLKAGLGRAMIAAVISGLGARPGLFRRVRVNDLSRRLHDGRRWWEHVADAYPAFEWVVTHDEDFQTHRPQAAPRVAKTDDFERKRAKLEELAREFDYDPAKVTLSPEKQVCAYLGQSFTAEGEAFPDGRIEIYYDPAMTDARMGCCLSHEIQHARYFAVRDAYIAEAEGGPLHRRFAKFTPKLLAAQRGVSDYSNEHWDAWRGAAPPALFSMELEEGGSEPINETIADVAKAFYNWGPDVRINPLWKELQRMVNEAYERLADGG